MIGYPGLEERKKFLSAERCEDHLETCWHFSCWWLPKSVRHKSVKYDTDMMGASLLAGQCIRLPLNSLPPSCFLCVEVQARGNRDAGIHTCYSSQS